MGLRLLEAVLAWGNPELVEAYQQLAGVAGDDVWRLVRLREIEADAVFNEVAGRITKVKLERIRTDLAREKDQIDANLAELDEVKAELLADLIQNWHVGKIMGAGYVISAEVRKPIPWELVAHLQWSNDGEDATYEDTTYFGVRLCWVEGSAPAPADQLASLIPDIVDDHTTPVSDDGYDQLAVWVYHTAKGFKNNPLAFVQKLGTLHRMADARKYLTLNDFVCLSENLQKRPSRRDVHAAFRTVFGVGRNRPPLGGWPLQPAFTDPARIPPYRG